MSTAIENTVGYKLIGRAREVATTNGKDAEGKPIIDWSMKLVMKVPECRSADGKSVDWAKTLVAWGEYLGPELAVAKLEEYQGIRFIDRARKLHQGSKTTKALSDDEIRKAMSDWSFREVRVAVAKKSADELVLESMLQLYELSTDDAQRAGIEIAIRAMREKMRAA